MNYLEPEDAQNRSGLRLALTAGVPGPWSESAKKIFDYKKIDYLPVIQRAAEPNEALVAWTGIRNAPIAIYNDEPPRTNFQDIVALAERLKPEPSLLPAEATERWQCFGISAAICGEGGYGWLRRHVMGERPGRSTSPSAKISTTTFSDDAPPATFDPHTLNRAYGGIEAEREAAAGRIVDILCSLEAQLASQRAAGSDYFVGSSITACDVHWACFSAMLKPMPAPVNPMPGWLREAYSYQGDLVDPDDYPLLIAHRDGLFEHHLGLPLDY